MTSHVALSNSPGLFLKDFEVVEILLRHPHRFFSEVGQGIDLPQKIRAMLISSAAFLAFYGFLLGSTHSLWQMVSSGVKTPLLFLMTLFICAPAMYIFNLLFGSNQTFTQSLALALIPITMTATILLSLAPVTLMFTLTTPDSYQFFKLLNVLFFSLSAIMGVFYLNVGLQTVTAAVRDKLSTSWMLLGFWFMIYAFSGSQLAWALRPFVGHPAAPFELFRQYGGNVYSNIIFSLGELLGFWIIK